MPKATVCSLWVLRDEEHPEAEERNYPGMLKVLQRSCDEHKLRHIVLTDWETSRSDKWPAGVQSFACRDVPRPLMQVCTELQARWLENQRYKMSRGAEPGDTIFVGADCIFLANPVRHYPSSPGLCLTYRTPRDRHPINTGTQMIRQHSLDKVTDIYRRVADRCGTFWCDDQRALCAEMAPLPPIVGTYERGGVKVAFLPMRKFNVRPRNEKDECQGAFMLHFRGKSYKKLFFDWTLRHRPEYLQ